MVLNYTTNKYPDAMRAIMGDDDAMRAIMGDDIEKVAKTLDKEP